MTPTQERGLYQSDYAAWVKYIAPRAIKRMRDEPQTKAQRWSMASPQLRAAIKDLLHEN